MELAGAASSGEGDPNHSGGIVWRPPPPGRAPTLRIGNDDVTWSTGPTSSPFTPFLHHVFSSLPKDSTGSKHSRFSYCLLFHQRFDNAFSLPKQTTSAWYRVRIGLTRTNHSNARFGSDAVSTPYCPKRGGTYGKGCPALTHSTMGTRTEVREGVARAQYQTFQRGPGVLLAQVASAACQGFTRPASFPGPRCWDAISQGLDAFLRDTMNTNRLPPPWPSSHSSHASKR